MNWLKISVAVLLTSAALVVALFATGAVLVGNAVAQTAHAAVQMKPMDPHDMPPELARFKDIPTAERFAHFKGVQVSLTDKDGQPVTIAVTPGVASSVSDKSLTIAGNDGASHTFSLDDQTKRGGGAITSGENVVVVTLDNTSAARAVFAFDPTKWNHDGWN